MNDANQSELEIREIKFGSTEYSEELALRYAVLRHPLGLPLSEKDTGLDVGDIHLGAFLEGCVVGCVVLRINSVLQGQMRQVSIDPSVQGRGLGRKLVDAFESRARAEGLTEIIMDARESARAFYEKLNYETVSAMYIQSTIPHVKMRKVL